MKKSLIPGVILGLLAVSLTPIAPTAFIASAYAATTPVTISTTNTSYVVGSQLHITGSSPAGKDITFKMVDSTGYVIHVDAIYGKDNNGQYSFDFTLPSNKTGTMTIIAGYGGASGEFALKNITVNNPSSTETGGSRGGGGGGGVYIPPTTSQPTDNSTGTVNLTAAIKESLSNGVVTVTFDSSKLTELMSSSATSASKVFVLDVKETGNTVKTELTTQVLSLLASKNEDVVLQVQTSTGAYNLPIKQLDVASIAREQGVSASDVKIVISMDKLQADKAAAVNSTASKQGWQVLSVPVDFTVSIVSSDGTSKPINSFTRYVERSIPVQSTVNPKTATGVMYNEANGTFSPVPTLFTGVNATLFRKGNSIYTIIDNPKTFSDISGHWAKNDIELLASKLIVNGIENDKFAPDNNITRAEFAALLVRSLAVEEVKATGFTDVTSANWFSGAVGAAKAAQLIAGFEDGTFQPNAKITREQMVTMIIRAFQFAGKEVSSDSAVINKFTDRADISDWSKDAVAKSIAAGVIQGMTDTTFAPHENATRAQATLMLERMLQYLQFINK
ncbi:MULTISPECIES: S-layer homology domain-containing protein [unclassified Paenibacillus]|uniref:S-layer homology domain-containing protein n=1 Tax=unclassified Paenibacillus TaxID=185978 RepID=UPI003638B264